MANDDDSLVEVSPAMKVVRCSCCRREGRNCVLIGPFFTAELHLCREHTRILFLPSQLAETERTSMTTTLAERPVTARVLRDGLTAADEAGELRDARLVLIAAPTQRGEVSALYLALDCGPYLRLEKVGTAEVYTLTLEGGYVASCTCAAGTYRPERGPCKHAVGITSLNHSEG